MNKQILLVLFCLTTYLADVSGQDVNETTLATDKKVRGENEIGINLFSVLNLTRSSKEYFVQINYVNGLLFKRAWNKNAIRVGFDYNYRTSNWESGGTYQYVKGHDQQFVGKLRLGYERRFTLRKVQPFAFSDVSLSYGQTKGTSGGWGDWTPIYSESSFDIRTTEILLDHGIGLKYRPISRLSVSLEINFSFGYEHSRYTDNRDTGQQFNFYFNPLRLLSINYHFGLGKKKQRHANNR